jgi:hypothetical protein
VKRLRSRETELRQEKSMHRSEEEKEQADLATQVSLYFVRIRWDGD